jgi:hypothetical protein
LLPYNFIICFVISLKIKTKLILLYSYKIIGVIFIKATVDGVIINKSDERMPMKSIIMPLREKEIKLIVNYYTSAL